MLFRSWSSGCARTCEWYRLKRRIDVDRGSTCRISRKPTIRQGALTGHERTFARALPATSAMRWNGDCDRAGPSVNAAHADLLEGHRLSWLLPIPRKIHRGKTTDAAPQARLDAKASRPRNRLRSRDTASLGEGETHHILGSPQAGCQTARLSEQEQQRLNRSVGIRSVRHR